MNESYDLSEKKYNFLVSSKPRIFRFCDKRIRSQEKTDRARIRLSNANNLNNAD